MFYEDREVYELDYRKMILSSTEFQYEIRK